MTSPEVFYLHIHGEQRGPYTIPQIDHLLNSGLIAEETLYWREGLEQWQPVTSIVRLRKRGNPWIKPAIILGVALVLAVLVQFFGSVALLGWRETNQHEYTAPAAYWRARSVVRAGAVPEGALVQFGNFEAARVKLQPPGAATVMLPGEVTHSKGMTRTVTWNVAMTYDEKAREWTGGAAREVTP
jgi:hypothetical protein